MNKTGIVIILLCFLAAAAVVLWERRKARKTMEEIERMLDAAMTGSFSETNFDESQLGGFKCSCTTGNQSSSSMTQQTICLTKYNFGISPHINLIKFGRYSRSSRNNKLIFCIVAGCLYHPLQIILNLTSSRWHAPSASQTHRVGLIDVFYYAGKH